MALFYEVNCVRSRKELNAALSGRCQLKHLRDYLKLIDFVNVTHF